jgi:hypothetical protein
MRLWCWVVPVSSDAPLSPRLLREGGMSPRCTAGPRGRDVRLIAERSGPPSQLREQVCTPLREVDDAGSHAKGVQAQPQDVHRRLEEVRAA